MSELARQKIITDFIIPKLSGKKIFLTGGTGFFGRSLLDLLIGQNIADRADLKLTLLSRDPNIFLNLWPKYSRIPWLKFTQGAIESFKFNDEAFDFILHFATPASASLNKSAPLQMSDVILNGTRRALDFCVKSGKEQVFIRELRSCLRASAARDKLCFRRHANCTSHAYFGLSIR